MARLRSNFRSGTTDVALAAGDTTISSPGLADLPVVAAPDELMLVLDPDTAREVVKVTAHAAGATTATIVRGQEGTTAAAHVLGITWIHAPLASDFATVAGVAPIVARMTADKNVQTATAAFADVNNALDLVVPAEVGDIIHVEAQGAWGGEAVYARMTYGVVVANAVVRHYQGASHGISGWGGPNGRVTHFGGGVLHTVAADEIENGAVRFRLRAFTDTNTAKTLYGNAATPLEFNAINLTRVGRSQQVDPKAEIYSSGILTTDAVFNPRPTTDTIITGLELTIPASTYERTFLVFGYVSSAQGGSATDNVRTTLYRDTTKIFNGNSDITLQGLGIYALVNEGGLEAQTLVGVPVTIPGDNAEHKISWQFNAVGTTNSWTFKTRYLVASLIAAAGGNGPRLLGRARTALATDGEAYAVTSTTWVELDAANLKVTFTAPASGVVDLVLYGVQAMSAAAWCYWGVFEGGAIRADSARTPNTSTFSFAQHTRKRISGLTPGQSYTWTWAARVDSQTMSILSGPNRGEVFMEVWSA